MAAIDGWRVVSIKLMQLLKIFQWPQRLKGLKWSYKDNPADHGSDICTLNIKKGLKYSIKSTATSLCSLCSTWNSKFCKFKILRKQQKGKKTKNKYNPTKERYNATL